MLEFVQALVDGVVLGATYALLGLGFTLIFGVLRRLNLAFGATVLVGLYAGSLAARAGGVGALGAVAVTVLVAVLAGLYVERCAFHALAGQAPVVSMIASFAAWMQLQEAVALLPDSRTIPYPSPVAPAAAEVAGVLLRVDAALTWGGATAMTLVLLGLLHRTRLGRAMRAVADEPEAAALMGVNVAAVSAVAFLIASGAGGVAGALIAASQQQVTPYFGLWATVKGLTAMVLGGAGSLSGAVGGGLALALVETQAAAFLGGQWRDLVAFGLLLAAVVARRSRAEESL